MVSKARIVVVEDEPAIRRGVSDALRLTGYDVAEAADGHSGLGWPPASRDVDLVLLDILLPRRDGLEVLCEVRKMHPARPVILLTARGTEDDRVRGPEARGRRLRGQAVHRPRAAGPRRGGPAADVNRSRPGRAHRQLRPGTIDLPRREVALAGRQADGALGDRDGPPAIPGEPPPAGGLARGAARAASGASRRTGWRRGRWTCTWPGCGRS